MAKEIPDDVQSAINILKKVEQFEFGHEYRRFLFIMAIVGLVAMIEGYLSYLIHRYVETDYTLVLTGEVIIDDPILTISSWLIQFAIISALLIYTRSSKGLLDTWTPLLRRLGFLWGLVYISSFLINVIMIYFDFEKLGPSIWSFLLGTAFLVSTMIIHPLPKKSTLRFGFYFLTVILWVLSLLLPFVDEQYAMFLVGMVIGLGLLSLSGILYWRT
ncbi:MAG: hypothetical protein ACXAC7_20365 [Candidatus Hodarchaeales archaeon]|jgi:hypothetical protein